MSRKLISKCDGCGVEIVEDDDSPVGILSGLPLGRRRSQSSEHWSSLNVPTGQFPVSFDLCDGCTKRIIDLLELRLPKPDEMMKRFGLGGLGGHAMSVISPLDFGPGSRMAPPWTPPPKVGESPYGALTPEELKALGIQLPPSVTPDQAIGPYTCPSCGTLREGPVPGLHCFMCHHPD